MYILFNTILYNRITQYLRYYTTVLYQYRPESSMFILFMLIRVDTVMIILISYSSIDRYLDNISSDKILYE